METMVAYRVLTNPCEPYELDDLLSGSSLLHMAEFSAPAMQRPLDTNDDVLFVGEEFEVDGRCVVLLACGTAQGAVSNDHGHHGHHGGGHHGGGHHGGHDDDDCDDHGHGHGHGHGDDCDDDDHHDECGDHGGHGQGHDHHGNGHGYGHHHDHGDEGCDDNDDHHGGHHGGHHGHENDCDDHCDDDHDHQAVGPIRNLLIAQDCDTGELIFIFPDQPLPNFGVHAMQITVEPGAYSFCDEEIVPNCFATGALIATPWGQAPVEQIKAGDFVLTARGTKARVLWAGSRTIARPELDHCPISFAPEFFNDGCARAMKLSPQHLVAIGRRGGQTLMAPAKALTSLDHVVQRANRNPVRYHHILLACHDLVLARGMQSESLLLSRRSLISVGARARAEISATLGVPEHRLHHTAQSTPCGIRLTCREARESLAQGLRPMMSDRTKIAA